MPTFEYRCTRCDTRFEQFVRTIGGEAKSAPCPKCGSPKTARELSVFAVGAGGAAAKSADAPGLCGRCGGPPGSCGLE